MGDGTGCDNMTAVIVKFQQKLQELPSTIDPSETEDALLAAAQQKKQGHTNTSPPQAAVKRSASPDTAADAADSADSCQSKRLKIESNVVETAEGNGKNSADVISSTPSSVDEQVESVGLNATENAIVVSST